MIPIDQQTDSDCYRACFASILELKYEDVPKLVADSSQLCAADKWLREEHDCTLLGVEGKVFAFPAMFHLMCGKSSRGIMHAVVGFQGVMVHDPHKSREGMLKIEGYEFIIPCSLLALFQMDWATYRKLPLKLKRIMVNFSRCWRIIVEELSIDSEIRD